MTIYSLWLTPISHKFHEYEANHLRDIHSMWLKQENNSACVALVTNYRHFCSLQSTSIYRLPGHVIGCDVEYLQSFSSLYCY